MFVFNLGSDNEAYNKHVQSIYAILIEDVELLWKVQPCPDFRQNTLRPLPEAHKIVLLIRWSFHALAIISNKRTVITGQLDLLQIMANLSRILFISKNILNLTEQLSLFHHHLVQELIGGDISAAT